MGTKRFRYQDDSPAAASTVVAATFDGLDEFDSLMILTTLQGGSGGTLDVYLQVRTKDESSDPGEWVDYAHFAQLADGAAALTRVWSVSRHQQQLTITAVGKGTSPALAAGSILGGEFGSEMRIVFVAGAGTSAGAEQTIDIIGTRLTR